LYNIMKKIISIILIAVIIVLPVCPATAADTITVNVLYNEAEDSLIISGTVNGEQGSKPLTLEITDSQNQMIAVLQTVAERNSDGVIVYQFEKIKLPFTALSGEYTATVSGHFVDSSKSETFSYLGGSDLFAVVKAVNDAKNTGTTTQYQTVLNNSQYMGLSRDKLIALGTNAQIVFGKVVDEEIYELPANAFDDLEKTRNAFVKLIAQASYALKIAEFASITTQAQLINWLDSYYNSFNFNKDSDITVESEVKITEYVQSVKNEVDFLERIKENTSLIVLTDIQKAIYQSAVLSTIKTQNDVLVIKLFNDFPNFLPVGGGLNQERKAEIISQIARRDYDSYENVVEAFLAEQNASGNTPSKSQGGGSSWGGSSSGKTYVAPSMPQGTEPANNIIFTDMKHADWATEAVEYLYNRNIINGKGEGIFAPNDYVTRAEFVKMLYLALGHEPAYSAEFAFSDVAPGAWYAPYASSAKEKGIAMGNEQNEFQPEERMTRQDMAVFLFRAYNMQANGAKLAFADEQSISGYAKEAVAALYNAKVLQGVGNNTFGPLDCATRAQAAQIIYNVLRNN